MVLEALNPPDQYIPLEKYLELSLKHSEAETEFFRYPNTFNKISGLMSRWRHQGKKEINLISLPCSVGYEPLTLIALALKAGFTASKINVTGVDINPEIINLAKSGQYWVIAENNAFCQLRFPLHPYTGDGKVFSGYLADLAHQVFNFDHLTSSAKLALPLPVKSEVLTRLNYLVGDIRYPDSINKTTKQQFDLAFIASINGTKFSPENNYQLGQWLSQKVNTKGIVVIPDLLAKYLPSNFHSVTPHHPLDDLFALQVFQKTST